MGIKTVISAECIRSAIYNIVNIGGWFCPGGFPGPSGPGLWYYEKTFNDETVGQVPSEGELIDATGISMEVANWYQSDGAPWNPSGFSKCLKITGAINKTTGYKIQMPTSIPNTYTLNFEVLMTLEQITGWYNPAYPGAQLGDGTDSERVWMNYFSGDQDIYTGVTHLGVAETQNAGDTGTDAAKSWVKMRMVISPQGGNPNMVTSIIKAADGLPVGTTTNVSQQNSKMVQTATGLDYLDGRVYSQAGSGYLHIARLYIGDANLGWPSDN